MTKGNEPAFEKSAYVSNEGSIDPPQEGLTKREYFATHLPLGDVTFPEIESAANFVGLQSVPDKNDIESLIKLYADVEAKIKVMKADALINALNK